LVLLFLLKDRAYFHATDSTGPEGALPAYILSEGYIQFFKMKYIVSLKEFVLYDKRNYNKFFHHPNPRCDNRRREFSRLFC
jgi:hypothetical protein